MQKKVCMFVWNHFTNDARVLRECKALTEEGYAVELIAIHNSNDKELKKYETKDGFNITRVCRYPKYLLLTRKIIRKVKSSKLFMLCFFGMLVSLFMISKIMGLLIIIYIALIGFSKSRALIVKTHIFLQMVIKGLKLNSDFYHSNDLNTLPQGIICSKILRRRILIYDSHEVQTSRTGYGKEVYYIEKILIKFIDKMIMTNKTRAKYVKNLYNIEMPEVVQNYPFYSGNESIKNKYDLHEILNIERDKPILLYQGGMQQGRGLEKIVEAIDKFNNGVTVFIGDGKLKPTIVKMVKDRNLEEKVRFLDKVPVHELKYYTANAYLGFQVLNNVCFNHYSACSNKLYEYIMSEVPVVACSFPEIKRVVDESKIGICIDSHSEREIARAVNELLENKKLYKKYKNNCIRAKEKYNWNNEKKEFTKIYNNLLKKID
ncbi:MAG: glycosyltransferase [Clostridium sp.]